MKGIMKLHPNLRILSGVFQGRTEHLRYLLAERLAWLVYPRYKFSDFGRLFLEDKELLLFYRRFYKTLNFHSLDRKHNLNQLFKLVRSVPGDTAECGVFTGASSYLICRNIQDLYKQHHLFDSFEGISTPGQEDGHYWCKNDLAASEGTVRENLKEFDCVVFHKGWIPSRFPDVLDKRFCFVHIDVDLYQPTWDSLCFFYDRMSSGGLILCDDYGFKTCPGATQAMNIFFDSKPEDVVSLSSGQGFILKK